MKGNFHIIGGTVQNLKFCEIMVMRMNSQGNLGGVNVCCTIKKEEGRRAIHISYQNAEEFLPVLAQK